MNFGEALHILRNGGSVRRAGWNGKGLSIHLKSPDKHSEMTLPYLYLRYPRDSKIYPEDRVPWAPSQTDTLADDWEVVTDDQVES